jgi:hypothetical protein
MRPADKKKTTNKKFVHVPQYTYIENLQANIIFILSSCECVKCEQNILIILSNPNIR